MVDIAKLESVELRELWKHEERGFSAWLADNLDVLSQAVGIKLTSPEREIDAGDFSVDLVVESDAGERVIIENQLESTNHDHLGKVLTYFTNLEAKIAIWIAKHPRPEHVRALQWLNEICPEDSAFYLVQLAAYRIAGSSPAPLFTVIVGPSSESKEIGKQKKELAEGHLLRRKFWEQLLERARAKGVTTHAQRSPSTDSWLGAGAGIMAGVSYNYNILTSSAAVDLWIQNEDKAANKRLFDRLNEHRDEIEKAFGAPLLWQRLDDKRASRIRCEVTGGGLRDSEENWPALQERMIDAMDRLAKAVRSVQSKT